MGVGTPGTAEAGTGPSEAGRLDRILVEQAGFPPWPVEPPGNWEGRTPRRCGEHRTVGSHWAWCHDCGEWCYPRDEALCRGCADAPEDEIERLRAIAVSLESECAALTDALTETTHEYRSTQASAHCVVRLSSGPCFRADGHPIHRTPARVRAELEERQP